MDLKAQSKVEAELQLISDTLMLCHYYQEARRIARIVEQNSSGK